jgi:myo-inositol-1(or 4)-monophosphatase
MGSDDSPGIDELKEFAMELIRGIGEEALVYYGQSKPRIKFDEGLVTAAELHLNDYFRNALTTRFPEHQVFVNTDLDRSYSHEGKRYLWIFDPLDGVDNFQAGIPIWGMSLALLDNFWPTIGMFYMPATEDLFHAQVGKQAFRDKTPIKISAQETVDDESLLLTFSRFHHHYRPVFPGKIRNLGCTAAHICYVAMGRADAAVIANESYQDLASTRVIIEAAGGHIYKMDGSEFSIDEYQDGQRISEHLIVAAAGNVEPVRACLKQTA